MELYYKRVDPEEKDPLLFQPPSHLCAIDTINSQKHAMAYENYLSFFLLLFLCWKIVTAQDTVDDYQSGSLKLSPATKYRFNPDMRMMLNNLLRYDSTFKRSSQFHHNYPFLRLSNRSKGSNQPVDDPIAALANGFLGSRGKRDEYVDEVPLPVFSNGFPASKG